MLNRLIESDLDNKEVDNAIFTLNTMYFFQCAEKQGFDKNQIKQEIANKLKVNKNKASDIIYRFAFNYFAYEKIMSCVDYIVKCQEGDICFEQ